MMAQEPVSLPWSFAALSPPYSDLDQAQAVVLPVPYDSTTDWRSGTRDGPHAIINASRYLELFDIESGQEIHRLGIHTLPELRPQMASPERMIQRIYRAAKNIVDKGKLLVMLGGEHSITLGPVKAYREKYSDLSVLQLDAHTDLRDSYKGTRYSHAAVMRRVSELCPVVPVGIRSMCQEEYDFIERTRLKVFYADGLVLNEKTIADIISSLSDNVYITIDLDAFDPSVMAAVGTPEPGGLEWYGVLRLLRRVAESRRVVGLDVVELCPAEGTVSCAFLAAKLTYKLIGYVLLKARN